MPSAASPAIRSPRQEITFFTITSTDEAKLTKSAMRLKWIVAPRAAQQCCGETGDGDENPNRSRGYGRVDPR
jgi:hypothetical protein